MPSSDKPKPPVSSDKHNKKRRGRPPTGRALETSLSNVRFSTELQSLLRVCAAAKGTSFSQFGREAVERYCAQVRNGGVSHSMVSRVDSRARVLHLKPHGGGIEILRTHQREAKECARLLGLNYSAFIRRALFEHCATNMTGLASAVRTTRRSGRGIFLN